MILVLAYSAVLLSFFSGLLGLMMYQRQHVPAFSRYMFNKLPRRSERCQSLIAVYLEEHRFPFFIAESGICFTGFVRCVRDIGRVERVDR